MRWRESVGDSGKADDVILEVQRLWPPFFGGRRICVEVQHVYILVYIVYHILHVYDELHPHQFMGESKLHH